MSKNFLIDRPRSDLYWTRPGPIIIVSWLVIGLASNFSDLTPVLGRLAILLENRFPRTPIGDASSLTGIVVLGGSAERLREAGRLARSLAHVKVFASGAGSAEYVQAMLGQDIAPERISLERQSRNTFENLLFSKKYVRPRPGERWILVTSAFHMPRSVGAFRKASFDVEASPVYNVHRDDMKRRYASARYEWLGLAYYWIRDRTSSLLPSP